MMLTHEERIQRLPVGLKRLWLGVLAAPVAWLLMEFVGYYLAARSCEPGKSGVPLAGTAHPSLTQTILTLVAAAVAVWGLVVSIASWRATDALASGPRPEAADPANPRAPTPEVGRARFLAFVGVLASALFLWGIVMFGIPAFLVNACSQAR